MVAITENEKWDPVLASGSPRRMEMFRREGFQPIIKIPCVSEELPALAPPQESALFLALKKALSVEKECALGQVIIAADTLVVKDEIFGKPASKEDGFRILTQLRGTTHQVMTGVAILVAHSPYRKVFVETTEVTFSQFTDEELVAYLDTEEPYDKAGGYAIQGNFQKYILEVVGDRDNVMGFPWKRARQEWIHLLDRMGEEALQ